MTEKPTRGGPGRGQGRKAKDPSGEVMRVRKIRMTDAQWSEVLLITPARVRELVVKEAAKVRRQQSSE